MTSLARLKFALVLVFAGGLTIGLVLGTNGVPGISAPNAHDAEKAKPIYERASREFGRKFEYPSK